MNWYIIRDCPNYAISEDGESVKNIKTNQLLKHNTSRFAKDGLRRVTLRRNTTYNNKTLSYPKAYTLEYLKTFINPKNKI